MTDQLVPFSAAERNLTAARFQGLADVPSELEWRDPLACDRLA